MAHQLLSSTRVMIYYGPLVRLIEANKTKRKLTWIISLQNELLHLKFRAYSFYHCKNDLVNNGSSKQTCNNLWSCATYGTTASRRCRTPPSGVLGTSDITPANWHKQHWHLRHPVCWVVHNVSQNDYYTMNRNKIWHVQVRSNVNRVQDHCQLASPYQLGRPMITKWFWHSLLPATAPVPV